MDLQELLKLPIGKRISERCNEEFVEYYGTNEEKAYFATTYQRVYGGFWFESREIYEMRGRVDSNKVFIPISEILAEIKLHTDTRENETIS